MTKLRYWPEASFLVHHTGPFPANGPPRATAFVRLPVDEDAAYRLECCMAVVSALGPLLRLCVHDLDAPDSPKWGHQ